MPLTVLRVGLLLVFTILSFGLHQKNCCDFIGEDSGPNLSDRSPLIIAFGGNAGVLSQAATED